MTEVVNLSLSCLFLIQLKVKNLSLVCIGNSAKISEIYLHGYRMDCCEISHILHRMMLITLWMPSLVIIRSNYSVQYLTYVQIPEIPVFPLSI